MNERNEAVSEPPTLLPDVDRERLKAWIEHALPVVLPIDLARAKRAARERARLDRAVMNRAKHLTTKGTETK